MDSVIHFEIVYDDVNRVQGFYQEVFDWKFSEMPEVDYLFANSVETNDQGMIEKPGAINGGMFKREKPFTGPVIVINVDSIDETVKKIENNGGEIVVAKQEVANMGYTCYFNDSEGNLLGLWESVTSQDE